MNIKKEITPFIELLAALILSFLIVLGTLHNIIKPLYDYRKRSLLKRIGSVLLWYVDFVAQIFLVVSYLLIQLGDFIKYIATFRFWKAVKHIVHEIAYSIDMLGNVTAGELIEDFVTPLEKTYFGLGDITISAAIGYCEWMARNGKPHSLNKFGWWLSRTLNKAFNEREHCLKYYRESITNHPLYGKKDFLNTTI
jgi:hypothetical protein